MIAKEVSAASAYESQANTEDLQTDLEAKEQELESNI